jgi:hypothetical protein
MTARGHQAPHRYIFRAHPRHQAPDAAKPSRSDTRSEEQGPKTVVLHPVVHRDRQLLDPLADWLEHHMTHDASAGDRDEAIAAAVICCGEGLGLLVTDSAGRAVKPGRAALGGEFSVEALKIRRVAWNNPADPDIVRNHAPILRREPGGSECRGSLLGWAIWHMGRLGDPWHDAAGIRPSSFNDGQHQQSG